VHSLISSYRFVPPIVFHTINTSFTILTFFFLPFRHIAPKWPMGIHANLLLKAWRWTALINISTRVWSGGVMTAKSSPAEGGCGRTFVYIDALVIIVVMVTWIACAIVGSYRICTNWVWWTIGCCVMAFVEILSDGKKNKYQYTWKWRYLGVELLQYSFIKIENIYVCQNLLSTVPVHLLSISLGLHILKINIPQPTPCKMYLL